MEKYSKTNLKYKITSQKPTEPLRGRGPAFRPVSFLRCKPHMHLLTCREYSEGWITWLFVPHLCRPLPMVFTLLNPRLCSSLKYYVFICVGLFVCPFVSEITQKVMRQFSWNKSGMILGRTHYTFPKPRKRSGTRAPRCSLISNKYCRSRYRSRGQHTQYQDPGTQQYMKKVSISVNTKQTLYLSAKDFIYKIFTAELVLNLWGKPATEGLEGT